MGEFADYALDETMEAENDRFLYRIGGMSDARAYDLGIIDHMGGYKHAPMFHRTLSKTCRYCGLGGLRWMQVKGQWRLGKGGKLHSCPQYTRATNLDVGEEGSGL